MLLSSGLDAAESKSCRSGVVEISIGNKNTLFKAEQTKPYFVPCEVKRRLKRDEALDYSTHRSMPLRYSPSGKKGEMGWSGG